MIRRADAWTCGMTGHVTGSMPCAQLVEFAKAHENACRQGQFIYMTAWTGQDV
jgi:hypothetical protein